jgi:iron complex outermembrane receptor protein
MPRGGGAFRPAHPSSSRFVPLRAFPWNFQHAAGMREELRMKPAKAIAAVLSATTCAAFSADPPVTHGPPVIVTATRFEQSRDEFPVTATVITRQDIERSTATSVIELLSQQAGIQVRDSTGGPDPQIDVRGFGQTGDLNTAVLVDGQRFNDIDTSPVKWSSIPLAAVERIEILPGSGAVLYGGGATGGVVNIVTRRPRAGERSAEVRAGVASYRARDLQGALALAGEQVGMRINVTDHRSDGYRANNDLRQRNLLADFRTLGRDGHVYAKLGIERQDLRNPGQLTLAELALDRRGTATPLDFSAREGARIDLGGSLRAGPAEFAANLAYRKQDIKAFFGAFGSEADTELANVAFSPRAKLGHRFGGFAHTLVGGIDIEEGSLDRNVSGVFFAGRTKARQDKQGVYLQNNAVLGRGWLLTMGARLQRAGTTREDRPPLAAAPPGRSDHLRASELALRHQLTAPLALYARVGRSFRLPSVEEINFTTATLLEPQTSTDRELGADYREGGARARISFYRIDLQNEIAFNPFLFDNINLAPTRREGLELDAALRVSATVDLFANYAHVLARFRSGTYGGVDVTGNRVPLVPRHALTVGGSWRAGRGTRLSVAVRHVGEQRLVNDEANALAQDIPAHTTLDLKLVHAAHRWQFEAGVKNLLDEAHYTQGGVNPAGVIRVFPAPERNGYLAARYTFD